MQKPLNAENLLRDVIHIDRKLLTIEAINWVLEYCDAGECGLAYDTFVYEITTGTYCPSPTALTRIKDAAAAMGLLYPSNSADS